MIKVIVENAEIKAENRETLAVGNVNSLPVDFVFSALWDGLNRVAVFTNGDRSISTAIVNDRCFIPWEVLTAEGKLYIALRGIGDEGKLVVCTENEFLGTVKPSSAAEAYTDAAEATPNVIDALISDVEELKASSGGGSGTPDWGQNDENGEGYIRNRPFYEIPDYSVEWDGNTEGLVCISEYYYRVSETPLRLEQFIGANLTVVVTVDDDVSLDSETYFLDEDSVSSETNEFIEFEGGFSVLEDVELDGVFFQRGLYFVCAAWTDDGHVYKQFVAELKKSEVTPLPLRYIPEGVEKTANMEDYISRDDSTHYPSCAAVYSAIEENRDRLTVNGQHFTSADYGNYNVELTIAARDVQLHCESYPYLSGDVQSQLQSLYTATQELQSDVTELGTTSQQRRSLSLALNGTASTPEISGRLLYSGSFTIFGMEEADTGEIATAIENADAVTATVGTTDYTFIRADGSNNFEIETGSFDGSSNCWRIRINLNPYSMECDISSKCVCLFVQNADDTGQHEYTDSFTYVAAKLALADRAPIFFCRGYMAFSQIYYPTYLGSNGEPIFYSRRDDSTLWKLTATAEGFTITAEQYATKSYVDNLIGNADTLIGSGVIA